MDDRKEFLDRPRVIFLVIHTSTSVHSLYVECLLFFFANSSSLIFVKPGHLEATGHTLQAFHTATSFDSGTKNWFAMKFQCAVIEGIRYGLSVLQEK